MRRLLRLGTPSLIGGQSRFHRMLRDGVEVEYRRARRHHRRRSGPTDRLRQSRRERLAGGQPVHRHRRPAQPPAGHRAVRQRPAARRHRAQERGRRERRRSGTRASTSSRPTRRRFPRCSHYNAVLVVSDGLAGAHRLARRRTRSGSSPGARSRARRCADDGAGTAGADRRRVRAAAVPRPASALHRLRGRRTRRAAQEDGRLPPVPRGERGGGGDAARQLA